MRLTVTDGVTSRCAHSQLGLRFFITDGAGQAGVKGAVPVGVSIVQTLLTHRVVIVLTVSVHALACRAHGAWHTPARYRVEEIVVGADADGVVGVRARRLHPHQAQALGAGPALLCVTVVL